MSSKPVWVWLPGQSQPVRAGVLTLENKIASFGYDEAYLETAGALPLDPAHLPFTRAQRGASPLRQMGIFGVFRDARPEGFGLGLLEAATQVHRDDPLALLEASAGDAVGALAICEDIESKVGFTPPSSAQLLAALAALPREAPSSRAAGDPALVAGTSLGGERPKLTVLHEGRLWVAKLQKASDPAHTPVREHLAMEAARAAGLRVAPTLLLRAGDREVLLVRRFDRGISAEGAMRRRLYASARSVLRRGPGDPRSGASRSYVALALQLRRWCGVTGFDAVEEQRELFRRMAFNAICANGDDHPRNHGLLRHSAGWRLAPGFDILPCNAFHGRQAMAVNRAGQTISTAEALVADCDVFGYSRDEALAFIDEATRVLLETWPRLAERAGFSSEQLPVRSPIWLRRDAVQAAAPGRQSELSLAWR
ncbi:type II toxin-antitoxin system HipA family toxin [Caenimonas sedimenti]|uniref:Type II toxin-antitoxin system HipA family toxin n=1 Tax=Caenimonas sedimenti TaxID=2596921 RepID=A0A562ZL35_9BURK|nr:type II toxin-antitoxin system HipA family toxin [Caenimonas sedimenti]TWO69045.1 type II toxin-antitoxin system HipA family toxin [Caenimonas sedimenti]